VSQRIRQSQGQSLLFNNLGSSLIIQSWVDACEKLCSCCGHVPVLHRELTVLKKPSNILISRQEKIIGEDIE
ncbi:hypothetical protein Avbf_15374, partial [Armadillidium vulgare]